MVTRCNDTLGPPSGLAMALALAATATLSACSLMTDLDQLQANWGQGDAASEAGPADAIPDQPLPPDAASDLGDVSSRYPQDGGIEADGGPVPADAARTPDADDDGRTEDAPEDAPAVPDAVTAMDSGAADGGADSSAPGERDAAGVIDAGAVDAASDAGADRPMMCPPAPARSATLYLANGTSTNTGCGYVRADLPRFIATVDPATFAESATCGACLRVQTPAGAVEAQVVELGPAKTAANATSVAVNGAAMKVLAPDGSTFVDQGVEWRFVPCTLPAGTGMVFQFQDGSSTSYAALLIQNHRFRIASVEYRISGAYKSLTRSSYNYWVAANGMGTGPFTLRITDVHGHVVEQTGIPLAAGVPFRGQAQFPACGST